MTITMTVKQLVDQFDDSEEVTGVSCKLIGTIDGSFSLIDRDATRLDEAYRIPVRVDGFLKILTDAGLEPRGGGQFAYGGNGTVNGRFIRVSEACQVVMVDFDSVEIEVHRSPPISIRKHSSSEI